METPNFESDAQRRYWNAAVKLHYRGTEVTVARVREITGGSNRDVSPVVKKFKDHQARLAEFEQTELPPELEETIQRSLRTLSLRIWEDAKELASSDIQEVAANKSEVEQELEKERSRNQDLNNDMAKMQIDIQDIKKELELAREALETEKEAHCITQDKNADLRGELKASEATIAQLNMAIRGKDHEIRREQEQKLITNEELRAVIKESSKLQGQKVQIEKELESLKLKHDSLQRQSLDLGIRNNSLKSEVHSLKDQLESALSQLHLSTVSAHAKPQEITGLRRQRRQVTPRRAGALNGVPGSGAS